MAIVAMLFSLSIAFGPAEATRPGAADDCSATFSETVCQNTDADQACRLAFSDSVCSGTHWCDDTGNATPGCIRTQTRLGDREIHKILPSPDGSKLYLGRTDYLGNDAYEANLSAYATQTDSITWTTGLRIEGHQKQFLGDMVYDDTHQRVIVVGQDTIEGSLPTDVALFALDAQNGSTVWSANFSSPGNAQDWTPSIEIVPDHGLAVVSGTAFDWSTNEAFLFSGAVRLDDGALVWTATIDVDETQSNQPQWLASAIRPANDTVRTASRIFMDGATRIHFADIDLATGQLVDALMTPASSSYWWIDEAIFDAEAERLWVTGMVWTGAENLLRFSELRPEQGEFAGHVGSAWQIDVDPMPGHDIWSQIRILHNQPGGSLVAYGFADERPCCEDLAFAASVPVDGTSILWKGPLPSEPVRCECFHNFAGAIDPISGRIYFRTQDGLNDRTSIMALEPQTGTTLWKQASPVDSNGAPVPLPLAGAVALAERSFDPEHGTSVYLTTYNA